MLKSTNEPENSVMNKSLSNVSTLIEVLRWRARHQPEKRAYTFLVDGEREEVHLTYGELDLRARAIAAQLQQMSASGERALLLYPSGLEFITAFFGCLYASVVAVPIYPPQRNDLDRLHGVAIDSQATVVLTTTAILSKIKPLLAHYPELATLQWLATDSKSQVASEWYEPVGVTPETLAFLQYTSGSTGTPKGVMITHSNLWHNKQISQAAFQQTEKTLIVSWLPLFHDMGLIACVLQPLYLGGPSILMSPIAFIQKPVRWLEAISRYKATASGGPNFAYELCVAKSTPEQRANLDLSSWKVAVNGAEPVRAETLERFAATFEPCGFRSSTFYPCYGLAEVTLLVSASQKTAPSILKVKKAALEQHQIIPVASHADEFQTIVSCGQNQLEVVIVDPDHLTTCASDQVGEIWVSGPSVAQGYWNRPQETKETFHAYLKAEGRNRGQGPFLRTGDLGFLQDNKLFVTGRLKDMIIIRGHNYYPQDIEKTVEQSHPNLRPNCGAAFSIEVEHQEQLVIVQEVKSKVNELMSHEIYSSIRQALAEKQQLRATAICLVKPRSVPKTSSGKIQRRACRDAFLAGTLKVVAKWSASPVHLMGQQEATLDNPPDHLGVIIQAEMAKIGGVPVSEVNPAQPLSTLGLDSLMMIELKNRLEIKWNISLPVASFMPDVTVAAVIKEVQQQIAKQAMSSPSQPMRAQALATGWEKKAYPIVPTQHWFFEGNYPEPHRWNLAALFEVPPDIDLLWLQEACHHSLKRHEALRLRFRKSPTGWQQIWGPPHAILPLLQVDFSRLPNEIKSAEVETKVEHLRTTIEFTKGPILRLVHFDFGKKQTGRLLIVVHHLIVDAFGFRLLLNDLFMAYQQLSQKQEVYLPPLKTSYTTWVERLMATAQSAACEQELPLWLTLLQAPITPLPLDFPGGDNYEASAQIVTIWMTREESQILLQTLPATFDVHITDILLTALLQAYHVWTGSQTLYFETQGHGRDELLAGVDLSRTACWANTIYPVLLQRPDTETTRLDSLQHVKEQLRRIPNSGLGYGLLRYLNQKLAIRQQLVELPEPEIKFLYHSNLFDLSTHQQTIFQAAKESIGSNWGEANHSRARLYLYGYVMAKQLKIELKYSRHMFKRSTIENLGEEITKQLRGLIYETSK